jgi:hypothetical protein
VKLKNREYGVNMSAGLGSRLFASANASPNVTSIEAAIVAYSALFPRKIPAPKERIENRKNIGDLSPPPVKHAAVVSSQPRRRRAPDAIRTFILLSKYNVTPEIATVANNIMKYRSMLLESTILPIKLMAALKTIANVAFLNISAILC